MTGRLNIRLFGTYDAKRHPRVAVLRDGLAEQASVSETNVPVGIDTAMRVAAISKPSRLLLFIPTLLRAWANLAVESRRGPRPDVVLVGHLGHLDILLARILFPSSRLCLDYLISLSDTADDRGIGRGGVIRRILRLMDWAATSVANDIVVDTPESIETVPARNRQKAVVIPVGAGDAWFEAGRAHAPSTEGPLRIVFYGLYTPLQSTPTIGAALRLLSQRGHAVEATMIGSGQERAAAEREANGLEITWLDWVDADTLPSIVAGHDVCLGIFGDGRKAHRVVPNKAYQGSAAGTVVVTSDTAPQRRVLSPDCLFVSPDDPTALADALAGLDKDAVLSRRVSIQEHARQHLGPDKIGAILIEHLEHALQ